MRNNIQNNWRDDLENADYFPAETFNKNEAWDKLYKRLHKHPQRKFAGWYYVAAACLLMIVAIFLFMNQEEQQPALADRPSPGHQPATGIAKKTILTGENSEKPNSITKEDKKSTAPFLHNRNYTVVKMERSPLPVLDTVSSGIIANTATTPTILLNGATVTTPPKKKLRVVHANEIDQPAEQSTVNQAAQKRGFELRIINNELYNPPSIPVSNNLILFKSRNTSN